MADDNGRPPSGSRGLRVLVAVFAAGSILLMVPDAVRVLSGRTTDPGTIFSVVFGGVVLLVIAACLIVMAARRRRASRRQQPPER